jgi:hypothetical protein
MLVDQALIIMNLELMTIMIFGAHQELCVCVTILI